jgi:hypothetical protein
VRRFRWNPDRAQGRHDPNALLCVDGHHPFRSKDQLILWVEVLWDHVAVFKVHGHTGDLGERTAATI